MTLPLPVREATVAVIIPLFQQAGLLPDAVQSVLSQRAPFAIHTIIVNDGCPFAESDAAGLTFATAYPGQVTYLRKPNGGLASARNAGIEYALANLPSARAMFFLDADNRLDPEALGTAFSFLESSSADWVYPDLDMFGLAAHFDMSSRFSLLQLLNENMCEAGSLVRLAVLESGLRFDESMRDGYEDWDFWLSAAARGFRGRRLASFGFQYRRRGASMVTSASRVDGEIRAYLKRKHWHFYAVQEILRLEQEHPRFALLIPGEDPVLLATDPARPQRVTREQFEQQFWEGIVDANERTTPGFLLATSRPTLDALTQQKLLHGLLHMLERQLQDWDVASAAVLSGSEAGTRIAASASPTPSQASVAMIRLPAAQAVARNWSAWDGLRRAPPLEVRIAGGSSQLAADTDPADTGLAEQLKDLSLSRYRASADRSWRWKGAKELRQQSFWAMARSAAEVTSALFPACHMRGERGIAIVCRVRAIGPLDDVVAGMLRDFRAAAWKVHLFMASEGGQAAVTGLPCDDVETITFLPLERRSEATAIDYYYGSEVLNFPGHAPEGDNARLLASLAGFDAVVFCDGENGHVAGELRRRGVATACHVTPPSRTAAGRDFGSPFGALAYEHAFDFIAVATSGLFDWLTGMGIPDEKLVGPRIPADAGVQSDERPHRSLVDALSRKVRFPWS